MVMNLPARISALAADWSSGDEEALNRLVSAVYPEMRRIARQYLRPGSGDHTMQSAALANEAYLRLIRAGASSARTVCTSLRCVPDHPADSGGPRARAGKGEARRERDSDSA